MSERSLEARTRARRRMLAIGMLVAIAAAVVLAVLVSAARSAVGVGYEGIYTSGFEASEFRACDDTTAVWWAGPANASAWAPVQAALRAQPGPPPRLYLRLRGRLHGPGRYGHMGAYPYELVVTRVRAARPLLATDCAG